MSYNLSMSFDVNTFVGNPSKTELYGLTKPQLKLVADKVEIEYESNAKKVELCQAILDYFIEEDLITVEQPPISSAVEIRRLELEHRANEQQRDQECQFKMKELELREKELEMRDREMQLQLKFSVICYRLVAYCCSLPLKVITVHYLEFTDLIRRPILLHLQDISEL